MTDKILERIRGLLAHGETVNISQEEAESYIIKAQELMTKYAIDEMLVRDKNTDQIITADFFMVSPYARAKVNAFAQIARVYNCKCVQSRRLGINPKNGKHGMHGWVTGYESDIQQLSVMFTSLLIQSTSAMMKADKGSTHGKSFRQGFIVGYFDHVYWLLKEQRKNVIDEKKQTTSDLLPVLMDRDRLVSEAYKERWPKLIKVSGDSYGSSNGWASGRSAARNADLNNPRISSRKALGR